jgi:hypothetical protein
MASEAAEKGAVVIPNPRVLRVGVCCTQVRRKTERGPEKTCFRVFYAASSAVP